MQELFISEEQVAPIEAMAARRKALKDVRLIQGDELIRADEIKTPDKISQDTLSALFDMGYSITFPYTNFSAIAYTEIPDDVFNMFGVDKHYRRIIYFSSRSTSNSDIQTEANSAIPGLLLINPILSFPSKTMQCMVEGCGSIEYYQRLMWVVRHFEVKLTSWVWDRSMVKPKRAILTPSGRIAGLVEHEYDHLDALTALNRGVQLVDFTKYPTAESLEKAIPGEWMTRKDTGLTELPAKIGGLWLAWDDLRQKIIVLDPEGKYVKDFPTPVQVPGI